MLYVLGKDIKNTTQYLQRSNGVLGLERVRYSPFPFYYLLLSSYHGYLFPVVSLTPILALIVGLKGIVTSIVGDLIHCTHDYNLTHDLCRKFPTVVLLLTSPVNFRHNLPANRSFLIILLTP